MIIPMTTTGRPQQRYDHRLRDLVQGTGDVAIATVLGIPRSTARGWLGKAPKVVVSLDVTDLRASELQQAVLELRRRVKKLTALLRLALALLRSSGFTLTHERLLDGRAKIRILRAVDRARAFVPLRALLRFLRLSPSPFHAWKRLQHTCALDDHSSCPHTSPHRLTPPEVRAIKDMVTALEYRAGPYPGSESRRVSGPLPPDMTRTRAGKSGMFVEIARQFPRLGSQNECADRP